MFDLEIPPMYSAMSYSSTVSKTSNRSDFTRTARVQLCCCALCGSHADVLLDSDFLEIGCRKASRVFAIRKRRISVDKTLIFWLVFTVWVAGPLYPFYTTRVIKLSAPFALLFFKRTITYQTQSHHTAGKWFPSILPHIFHLLFHRENRLVVNWVLFPPLTVALVVLL